MRLGRRPPPLERCAVPDGPFQGRGGRQRGRGGGWDGPREYWHRWRLRVAAIRPCIAPAAIAAPRPPRGLRRRLLPFFVLCCGGPHVSRPRYWRFLCRASGLFLWQRLSHGRRRHHRRFCCPFGDPRGRGVDAATSGEPPLPHVHSVPLASLVPSRLFPTNVCPH